jgi:hypothetical protein
MERLPSFLVLEIYSFLDTPSSLLNCCAVCRTTHSAFLLLPDRVWKTILSHNIPANFDLLILREGETWKHATKFMWKEFTIKWVEVLSDPHFFGRASFLHCEPGQDSLVFGDPDPNRYTHRLVDYESALNSFGEHELFEELFDEESSAEEFTFQCSAIEFELPQHSKLKIVVGAEVRNYILPC